MKTAGDLHAGLKAAGISVVDVSIGKRDDRATWRITYAPDITKAQQAAAQAIVDAFDINAPEPPSFIEAVRADLQAATTVGQVKAVIAKLLDGLDGGTGGQRA